MNVTREDVARAAGVSTATVSYVINNGPRPVSPETRQRVLNVIAELNYRPNRLARSLTTGKTHTIGIIIPDISDPFFPLMILGAENLARNRGYSVVLCNAARDPALELEYLDLLDSRTDGLIIAGSRLDSEGLKVASSNHCTVILTPYSIPGTSLFAIDDFTGGRLVGEYLISLGHREIRYLEGTWANSAPYRYQGLINAMQASGLPTDHVLAGSVAPATVEGARRVALRLLEADTAMTVLVCYDDMLALGVLRACADLAKRVPDDLSVVGFNDVPEAERSCPPLTTVRVDQYGLGVAMMQTLLDVIDQRNPHDEQNLFPVHLTVRGSCAPPRLST